MSRMVINYKRCVMVELLRYEIISKYVHSTNIMFSNIWNNSIKGFLFHGNFFCFVKAQPHRKERNYVGVCTCSITILSSPHSESRCLYSFSVAFYEPMCCMGDSVLCMKLVKCHPLFSNNMPLRLLIKLFSKCSIQLVEDRIA